MIMDYYNPADLTTEDLIKRVRIGNATQEFIRTPTGLAIAARAIDEYRNGIEAFQKMTDLATKRGVEGRSIEIMAPLLHMTKSMIIEKGLSLGACFEKTWSCYKGSKKACGKCDSCQLRLKGFKETGQCDPISYEFYPKWYQKV